MKDLMGTMLSAAAQERMQKMAEMKRSVEGKLAPARELLTEGEMRRLKIDPSLMKPEDRILEDPSSQVSRMQARWKPRYRPNAGGRWRLPLPPGSSSSDPLKCG